MRIILLAIALPLFSGCSSVQKKAHIDALRNLEPIAAGDDYSRLSGIVDPEIIEALHLMREIERVAR